MTDNLTPDETALAALHAKSTDHLRNGEPYSTEFFAAAHNQLPTLLATISELRQQLSLIRRCSENHSYVASTHDEPCPWCAAQKMEAEAAETRMYLRQVYGVDAPITLPELAKKCVGDISELRAEIARLREALSTAEEYIALAVGDFGYGHVTDGDAELLAKIRKACGLDAAKEST